MEGEVYCQSKAILRLLGCLHGFYPKDDEKAWLCDSNIEANEDIRETIWRLMDDSNKEK